MQENKYSELDKLFQSRLKNVGQDTTWNDPGDKPLHYALEHMVKRKRRKRPFLFLLLGSLFLVTALSFIIYQGMGRIDKLEEKVENFTVATTTGNASGNEEFPAQVTGKLPVTEISSETNGFSEMSDLVSEDLPSVFDSRRNNISTQQTISTTVEDNKVSIISRSDVLYHPSSKGKRIKESMARDSHVAALEMLSLFPLLTDNERVRLNTSFVNPNSEGVDIRNMVYIKGGLTSSSFSMTNLPEVTYSLTEYDHSYVGYQMGGGLLMGITDHLGLDVSLAVRKMTNKSIYRDTRMYDIANETLDSDGNWIYEDNLDVTSPIGLHPAHLRASISPGMFEHEGALIHQSDIRQDFFLLQLGVAPYYSVAVSDHWSIGIGVGPDIHYVISGKNTMNTSLKSDNDVEMKDSFLSDNEGVNQWTLGLRGKVNVNYHISDRYSLGVQLDRSYRLSSLRKTQSGGDIRTFYKDLGLSVVAGKRF